MTYADARARIAERFGTAQIEGTAPPASPAQIADGTPLVVTVPVDEWAAFARFAKDTLGCLAFSFSTVVDWKEQGLEVVAKLDNLSDAVSVIAKTRLAHGVSSCPSLTSVYRGANWMERECYDMFGIRFEGHPDLRRILLADDWEGHPLLKSYAVDTPYPPYR